MFHLSSVNVEIYTLNQSRNWKYRISICLIALNQVFCSMSADKVYCFKSVWLSTKPLHEPILIYNRWGSVTQDQVHKISIRKMSLKKNTVVKLLPHLSGANELILLHDDVIKWKHFPRYWPFVRGIHRPRWIPHTKASDAELWCFIWSAPE